MNVRSERWAISSGIAFTVLFVAGLLVTFGNLPSYNNDDPVAKVDAAVRSTYADSGSRLAIILGAVIIVVSAGALLWFVSGLHARMARHGASKVTRDVLLGAGIVAAASIVAGATALASIAGDLSVGNDPPIDSADVMRVLPELGYPLILLGAMMAIAVVIGITTMLALRAQLLPRWLGYAGWIAVIGAVLALSFVTMVLVGLWFLIVGIIAALDRLPQPAEVSVPDRSGVDA